MDLLKDRLALITGAGGGLGSALARGFAREGARVILADLDTTRTSLVVREIVSEGGTAYSEVLDVSNRQSSRDFADLVLARYGPIDILVNNAGVSGRSRIDDPEAPAVWDRILAVNLEGVFNVTHAFVPQLKTTRGCLINLSSIVAFVSGISSAGYIASKGAVRSLTQALARDLAPFGVRAIAFAHGLMLKVMVAG